MPSGKTHEKINSKFLHVLVFITLHIISLLQFGWMGLASSLLFLSGYLIGTYYLGPDLDIKSRPFQRWKILRFIWIPYQRMFGHRSFWTHGLLIGDIIRLLYLAFWLCIPLGVWATISMNQMTATVTALRDFLLVHPWEIGWFILGIVTASTLHIVSDVIGSAYKKRRRKKRSR